MNRLLIVGILVISTMPLFALAARPDLAKLKAEAQNVVSIIKGDKAKTDVYCQINDLGLIRKKLRHYPSRSSNWRKSLVPNTLSW